MQTASWCILCHIYHFVKILTMATMTGLFNLGCHKDDPATNGKKYSRAIELTRVSNDHLAAIDPKDAKNKSGKQSILEVSRSSR